MSRFKKAIFVAFIVGFFLCTSAWAVDKKPVFIFASEEEGRSILTARDKFIENTSPFDRAVRTRSEKPVSVGQFLTFIGNNVTSWDNEEKEQVQKILSSLAPRFASYASFLPDRIYLIRTTGNEEGGVAYTRGNAIVFPRRLSMTNTVGLYKLISHELFHIISRHNKKIGDEFYGIIGFNKCPAYRLPESLENRRITNPDAPLNEYCIRVKAAGKDIVVLPLLYSQVDTYSKRDGEELFDYLQAAFISIAQVKSPGQKPITLKEKEMILYKEEELQGFYEQIGENTDYTIHPEEILADNFSYLFLEVTEMESPQIIEKMKRVFKKYR
ncbi:MAG: hypothetical protein H6Q52_1543 [Deltaproteobacteria bacterium]|nr:hypothetical protein [Deltaproteobacteria bacterium]